MAQVTENVVDLCSGARGWEALTELDAVGIEMDPWACATSKAAGYLTLRQDIRTIDPRRFKGYDGVIASPPCQDASTANQGKKLPERAALVWEPHRFIDVIRPQWVALEQVPSVLVVWRWYEAWLRSIGYETWAGVLSAERYGVPQVRKRAVLIAHRDRRVFQPPPTHRGYNTSKGRHEPPNLLDLPSALNAYEGGVTIDRRMNNAPIVGADRPAPTVTVSAGGKSQWLLHRPATTVCADPRVAAPGHHDGPQMADAARLNVADAARLQSFPADWPWQGTKTAVHRQIGNAIPPLLAAAILQQVSSCPG
jgi:DNA (cytosine-5)-methyltransferase 1